ncbi:hypothetical protein CLOSTMETH_03518 [[Clostridium] methylpentosum DSM 5476]|uniref:Uncharacterized protein n=1 Tax=[Clostridium] methylpentosum DSM 5476 TaxID=537013 RepID=C0EI23_9FIRM|nr:hypothetical protein CLOSTMETH_03518 [[Clostridium] methylpentosum DSM 5476]
MSFYLYKFISFGIIKGNCALQRGEKCYASFAGAFFSAGSSVIDCICFAHLCFYRLLCEDFAEPQ